MCKFSDILDDDDLAASTRASRRRRELAELTPENVSVIMTTDDPKPTYVFFYGGIYSQWHHAPMVIDGRQYNCCEQWMMAQKAMLFGDADALARIMATPRPDVQKEIGKKVKKFDDASWVAVCQKIVYDGNMAKFTQHAALREQLLATGEAAIVEASPTDTRWGIGLAVNDPRVWDPKEWRGTNWLGNAIMRVRKELQADAQSQR